MVKYLTDGPAYAPVTFPAGETLQVRVQTNRTAAIPATTNNAGVSTCVVRRNWSKASAVCQEQSSMGRNALTIRITSAHPDRIFQAVTTNMMGTTPWINQIASHSIIAKMKPK